LNVTAPDGQAYSMPFYMDFDAVPTAAAQARYSADGLVLDASAASDAEGALVAYAWLSPSGLKRVTSKPVLRVLKDEDFHQDVVRNGAVKLFVKDSSGQYASVKVTPQAASTLWSPEQLAANQAVVDAVNMGSFTVGQATVVTVEGRDLTPGLWLDTTLGSCTALSRSSYATSFSCASSRAGAAVLKVTREDGLVLTSRNVVVSAPAVSSTVDGSDFTSGMFSAYKVPSGVGGAGYWIDSHSSTGLFNGVYAITHKVWRLDATPAWLRQGSFNNSLLLLSADGKWLTEGLDGTLQPVGGSGSGQFVYVSNVLSRGLSFSASTPATIDLATVAGLDATGVLSLPAGAKVFVQAPSVRQGDEYRLFDANVNGVKAESSLAAFRAANDAGSGGFWCFNELCWRFEAGDASGVLRLYAPSYTANALPTPLDTAATWSMQMVRGVPLLMLNIPASVSQRGGLHTGERYFFAVGPTGSVQMGQFSPSGSTDAADDGSLSMSFNRIALDAILKHLGLPLSPLP
jgi:hypothetical protein